MYSSKLHHTQIDKFHHIARLGVYALLMVSVVGTTISLNSPGTSVGSSGARADTICPNLSEQVCKSHHPDGLCAWYEKINCSPGGKNPSGPFKYGCYYRGTGETDVCSFSGIPLVTLTPIPVATSIPTSTPTSTPTSAATNTPTPFHAPVRDPKNIVTQHLSGAFPISVTGTLKNTATEFVAMYTVTLENNREYILDAVGESDPDADLDMFYYPDSNSGFVVGSQDIPAVSRGSHETIVVPRLANSGSHTARILIKYFGGANDDRFNAKFWSLHFTLNIADKTGSSIPPTSSSISCDNLIIDPSETAVEGSVVISNGRKTASVGPGGKVRFVLGLKDAPTAPSKAPNLNIYSGGVKLTEGVNMFPQGDVYNGVYKKEYNFENIKSLDPTKTNFQFNAQLQDANASTDFAWGSAANCVVSVNLLTATPVPASPMTCERKTCSTGSKIYYEGRRSQAGGLQSIAYFTDANCTAPDITQGFLDGSYCGRVFDPGTNGNVTIPNRLWIKYVVTIPSAPQHSGDKFVIGAKNSGGSLRSCVGNIGSVEFSSPQGAQFVECRRGDNVRTLIVKLVGQEEIKSWLAGSELLWGIRTNDPTTSTGTKVITGRGAEGTTAVVGNIRTLGETEQYIEIPLIINFD